MKALIAMSCALAVAACAPAGEPFAVFRARSLPVLERSCAATACHGVAPDAEARGEVIDWSQLFFRLDAAGRIADPPAAYGAAKRRIDTQEEPGFSTLLRKPLSVERGGLGHLGGASFAAPEGPEYRALAEWIALERAGGEDPPPLSELEQVFAATVQPVLVEGTCFTARCHGAEAGGTPYHLDPGYEGRFPVSATRKNYEATLAMASLDGWATQSRVLRKAQPLGPGILHKGLNFDFFAGNPGGGATALLEWICAERRARTGGDCAAAGELPMSGFVVVRGPVPASHAFELDTFAPGSDLYLATVEGPELPVVSLENLTAHLHPGGPADVRDPAVSRDGRRVVFAMRRHAGEGHHLWLLELGSRAARQLTFGNAALPGGGLATDRDPTFGPGDTVWFASTRAGHVADQGRLLDAELYSLDVQTLALRRWTYTPHVERKPAFLDVGDEAGGEVSFSVLRDALPAQARAHIFRFPPSQRTEYHQHFGITPIADFVFDLRELPDGRYVATVGQLPAPGHAGKLAIIERNFGPEINERSAASQPALERYEPPMVLLPLDGSWRDPAPLPDGRLLAAHVYGGLDGGTLSTRIELLELAERAGGPVISREVVLLDEPGVAFSDPEPVALRAPVREDGEALPQSGEETAVFRHQGLPMIDALLANLSPSGTKRPLEGVRFVRLVEHLPRSPASRAVAAAGVHGPARALAELPVEADGSFQARVPAGVPFRVQALDASGMAIGVMHNRWYYALPGQVLTQGLAAVSGGRRYGSRCAACHGDAGGSALPPAQEPLDTISGASLSLARFEGQDPRRPRSPAVLGAQSRIEVDFVRDVQPIFDRRCGACHAGAAPAGGVDLGAGAGRRFSRAYEALVEGRWVDDGDARARASPLIELLTGRELDAPRSTPAAPHLAAKGAAELTAGELLTLVRWIELGATFEGTP
ncbi:MAG: hypothetical protein IPJ65_13940 [Archangiaceae bacterium]|nr:hypothetical protein [Archangiaceae bacterium]